MKAVDALASLSGKLSIAITPCLGSVVNELYAERLIVFEFKDELINGEGTNAKKANKLVTELERSLKVEDEPEQVLQKLCSVLMRHNEPQLTQIAEKLLLVTGKICHTQTVLTDLVWHMVITNMKDNSSCFSLLGFPNSII